MSALTIGDAMSAVGWLPVALSFVGALKCAEWAARIVLWCLDRSVGARRQTSGGSDQ